MYTETRDLIKKFIAAFMIAAVVFSLAALVISGGLSIGRDRDLNADENVNAVAEGCSFNILLVMTDYVPDKFDDYDPRWVKNTLGLNVSAPTKAPESYLAGYRKVYAEDMVLVRFDKERAQITFTPISGSTLVSIKGIQLRLEEVAGEWGIDVLRDEIHAMTGLEIDSYAVFTPQSAAEALDKIGPVDYTVKCNMDYSVPERGIDIKLNAGSYRLDGKNAVDMLRFDKYDGLGVTRKDIAEGYVKKIIKKIENSFTYDEIRYIINSISDIAYTDFRPSERTYEIELMIRVAKLNVITLDLVGDWQELGGIMHFVPNETETLKFLMPYRRSSFKSS